MKQRAGSVLRLTTPVRALAQRFAFLLLLSAAVGLIIVGRVDTVLVERARTTVVDAFAPILEAFSRPIATVADIVDNVRELAHLRSENARLREESQRLVRWQQVARRLESENAALRDMLNYVPDPSARYITGRVIAASPGPFVRSVLVNVGVRDGVGKGQATVNGQGLVGRVAEVGHRSARVLLITDLNSRIPVVVGFSRERAILAGDNSDRPEILYLPAEVQVSPGDRVVTSGHGGVFAPGLPIGVVAAVGDDGVRVQPFVDWDRLEYLRLIDFGADDLLSAPQGPPEDAKGGR